MRDRILALLVNRVSMTCRALMEVDRVKKTQWWDEGPYNGRSHEKRRVVQEVLGDGALRQGVTRCRSGHGKEADVQAQTQEGKARAAAVRRAPRQGQGQEHCGKVLEKSDRKATARANVRRNR